MKNTVPSTSWIQGWQQKPNGRLRLFCFPYAGGGASIFRHFSTYLPPEIEVWPVQLPGRENRFTERPFSCIEELIDPLQQALLPYLTEPYAFFGHSMGALIGFELTRSLRRKEYTPGPLHLFVSGHGAPHLPSPRPLLHQLSDSQLIGELRSFDGTPEEILKHDEMMHLFLPLIRADLTLCETHVYTHESPLNCPISAFGGYCDKEAPYETIQAWKKQTLSAFKARFFVGNHFFFQKEQNTLLSAIARELLCSLQGLRDNG